jgi:ABC-type sugar transport system substrate-binding protein
MRDALDELFHSARWQQNHAGAETEAILNANNTDDGVFKPEWGMGTAIDWKVKVNALEGPRW